MSKLAFPIKIHQKTQKSGLNKKKYFGKVVIPALSTKTNSIRLDNKLGYRPSVYLRISYRNYYKLLLFQNKMILAKKNNSFG